MASPNASGSINLLIRHYEAKIGSTPRAATMKAIVIHTASEAGPDEGPDYQNGWGLLNAEDAANIIAADTLAPQHIIEDNLVSATQDTHSFTAGSPMIMRVTVVWTDPAGTPPAASLDPLTPMLVNDLDLRVEHIPTATVYYPWRLDPLNPASAASQGDNSVDNVEVVEIPCVETGLYVATVSHKGSLSSGSQDYSLIWSEREDYRPVCAVVPNSLDFGLVERFDSLDMSFTLSNPRTCDTLSGTVSESCNHYSIVSGAGPYALPPGQSLPVTVRFSPTALGTRNCTIFTGYPSCDVSCTGIGLDPPPICSVDADTLDFGTVTIPGVKIMSFDITNTGYSTLTGSVSASCPNYFITQGAGSYSLTNGQSHTVNVLFSATAGTHTCTVETGNAICADVFCTAVGEPPAACSVAPDTLDFGTVLVGSFKDTVFTITNAGGDTLSGTVSEVCDHYSIVAGGGSYSLTAGQFRDVTMRYAPSSDGVHTCTVETGSGLCIDVFCTGVGEPPAACSVAPDTLKFGAVSVNDSLDMTFSITNTGGDTLSGAASETCDHYSIVSGGGPFSLAASETVFVSVRFKPTSLGSHNCTIATGDPTCIDVVCTGTGDPSTGAGTPRVLTFALGQNYPNPFNPTTTISFTLPEMARTNLSIFNVGGGLVKTLVDGILPAGVKHATWNGRDASGDPVSSGVYFYRLKAGNRVMTKKMILLK